MSELLGLSFDGPASPEISFGGSDEARRAGRSGWGVAFYPVGELSAAVTRNPLADQSTGVMELRHDWERFRTSLVVAHLRGAAKRAAHRDTHPFERSFGGRSWVLAHSGDLEGDLVAELPLPADPQYVPVGSTDSEHLFNWLLSQAAAVGARSIDELGHAHLADLLRQANELGSLNLLVADGDDVVAYQDAGSAKQLWWSRRVPPHQSSRLSSDGVVVDMSSLEDASRTVLVVSTVAFEAEGWTPMLPGQLLVARRGSLVFDSAAQPLAPSIQAPLGAPPIASSAPLLVASPPPDSAIPGPLVRTLEVRHSTTYSYDTPVDRSSNRFRLTPIYDTSQLVLKHDITIDADGTRFRFEDVFGNTVTGFETSSPFTSLTVEARSIVQVRALIDRPDLLPGRSTLPLRWMPWQRQMMSPYLLPVELPENQLRELADFAESFVVRNRHDLLATLDDLTATIKRDFYYTPGFTTLETSSYDVYRSRAGVCQDFANLMICVCRLLDIPARYRVGYIFTGADYENTIQSEASHAWVEVYIPFLGWRGYDPTNGSRVGSDHVRVASGRNYRDATPTSGVIRGGTGEKLSIAVEVVDASNQAEPPRRQQQHQL